jgi:hypothetical protein
MPVNYSCYPDDWHEISRRIRFERAGGRCEWLEDGERCEAVNGQPHPITGSKVVLTVMHLDHNPQHCTNDNLLAACQMHHLRYDAAHHAVNSAQTRRRRKVEAGQLEMLS